MRRVIEVYLSLFLFPLFGACCQRGEEIRRIERGTNFLAAWSLDVLSFES